MFCRVEFFFREKWFGEFSRNFFSRKTELFGKWMDNHFWLTFSSLFVIDILSMCMQCCYKDWNHSLHLFRNLTIFNLYTLNSSIFIEYDKIKWFERVHTIFWANAFLFRIHSHFHHSLIGPGPFLIHWIIIPRKLSSFLTIILWNAVEKFLRWFRHRFTSYWNRLQWCHNVTFVHWSIRTRNQRDWWYCL